REKNHLKRRLRKAQKERRSRINCGIFLSLGISVILNRQEHFYMTQEIPLTSSKAFLSTMDLMQAVKREGEKFQEYYLWLERAMPRAFFEEVSQENFLLITHSLMGFNLQNYFSTINRKNAAIGLCLDTPDADLRILKPFAFFGIKSYQAYVS